MHNFRNLIIWKESMELVKDIYQMTDYFPREEKYGIVSQIQRSAVSIPSNIAEGAGRGTDREFSHFLSIAIGSSFELYTQVVLSHLLGYITEDEQISTIQKIDLIQKKMTVFKKRIDTNIKQRNDPTSNSETFQHQTVKRSNIKQ